MRTRALGRSGLAISEIGFGCGNVGGLLVRGDRSAQLRAVERAIELGISYFDTAAQYGDGVSEQNLGRALAELRADVLVGTKINVTQEDLAAGPERIRRLFEAGLARLGRESVDVLFYHGRIVQDAGAERRGLTAAQVMGPLLDAFRPFQREGRARLLGFTGLGDTDEMRKVLQPGGFDVFHCYFNAVNPSSAYDVPDGLEPQHLGRLLDRAAKAGIGAFAIRILAAGALSDEDERHPLAGGTGGALVGGTDYAGDRARAERLRPLARELGVGLPELAVRFVLSSPQVSCALVGISSLAQIETAARAAAAGPLPADVVQRIVDLTAQPLES